MVSKASEDLPEPESPVMTVSELRGISTLMFLRLCWRAPRTTSFVRPMIPNAPSTGAPAPSEHTAARITFHHSRPNSPGSTRLHFRSAARHCSARLLFTLSFEGRRAPPLKRRRRAHTISLALPFKPFQNILALPAFSVPSVPLCPNLFPRPGRAANPVQPFLDG